MFLGMQRGRELLHSLENLWYQKTAQQSDIWSKRIVALCFTWIYCRHQMFLVQVACQSLVGNRQRLRKGLLRQNHSHSLYIQMQRVLTLATNSSHWAVGQNLSYLVGNGCHPAVVYLKGLWDSHWLLPNPPTKARAQSHFLSLHALKAWTETRRRRSKAWLKGPSLEASWLTTHLACFFASSAISGPSLIGCFWSNKSIESMQRVVTYSPTHCQVRRSLRRYMCIFCAHFQNSRRWGDMRCLSFFNWWFNSRPSCLNQLGSA